MSKIDRGLGVEKIGLSETVAEKDRNIGEGVERVSVLKSKKKELKLKLRETEPRILELKR